MIKVTVEETTTLKMSSREALWLRTIMLNSSTETASISNTFNAVEDECMRSSFYKALYESENL